METTSGSGLNLAIQRWREGLASSPALQRENIDELESHLRDSMSDLQSRGLSAEEAFIVATKRVGSGESLIAEFEKINVGAVWLDRVLWVLIAVQVWGLVLHMVGTIAEYSTAIVLKYAGVEAASGSHTSYPADFLRLPVALFALAHVVALAASAALCWWLIVRHGSTLATRFKPWVAKRGRLLVTCMALCLVTLIGNVIPVLFGGVWVLREAWRETLGYWVDAQIWTAPLQTVALIAITLLLARNRWRLNET